jgi:hypothetical protein
MGTLVYSSRNCKYSTEMVSIVRQNPSLSAAVKFHDVITQGVPKGISRVPTLVTGNGVYVGKDISDYFESLLPSEAEPFKFCSTLGTTMDGTSDNGSFFDIQQFGSKLEPVISKELQDRISKNVNDAYQEIKK